MITKTKPSFKETRRVTTMDLDDVGLSFNAQRVGPNNFIDLRKANYGEGFRMPTIGQLAHLVHASLENRKEYESAREVVKTLKDYWLAGNTALLWTPNGLYAIDEPEIKDDRVSIDEKTLRSKLGSIQKDDVAYSDDGRVRFTPYGFKVGEQSASDLASNSGIIAIFGTPEEADAVATVSEHYRLKPRFWAFESIVEPLIRVPVLDSDGFGYGLSVSGSWDDLYGGRCSFGVRETGEASRANFR